MSTSFQSTSQPASTPEDTTPIILTTETRESNASGNLHGGSILGTLSHGAQQLCAQLYPGSSWEEWHITHISNFVFLAPVPPGSTLTLQCTAPPQTDGHTITLELSATLPATDSTPPIPCARGIFVTKPGQ